jgi:hypothetical protein
LLDRPSSQVALLVFNRLGTRIMSKDIGTRLEHAFRDEKERASKRPCGRRESARLAEERFEPDRQTPRLKRE